MLKIQKKAGYTHRISWEENIKGIGKVVKSFPTTRDAVQMHVSAMKKSPEQIFNIKVERI